jgi:hypothetical protein
VAVRCKPETKEARKSTGKQRYLKILENKKIDPGFMRFPDRGLKITLIITSAPQKCTRMDRVVLSASEWNLKSIFYRSTGPDTPLEYPISNSQRPTSII